MKSVLKNKSYKYPKTLIFILAIIVAYFAFKNPTMVGKIQTLETFGNLGIFFSGMLFAAGFSAPFAVGYFILINPSNIFLAAIIAGAGALIVDFLF